MNRLKKTGFIISTTLLTSACNFNIQELSDPTEITNRASQDLVSGPDINFHKANDVFILNLNILPPEGFLRIGLLDGRSSR